MSSLPASLDSATPAMRQYLDVKRQHRDAIVFFRMGDFYEMFYEDALTASRVLELTLTSRAQGRGRRRDSDVRRAVPRRRHVPRPARCARATASPSAIRSKTRAKPRASSSAKSRASSRPARSPTRRISTRASRRSWRRWRRPRRRDRLGPRVPRRLDGRIRGDRIPRARTPRRALAAELAVLRPTEAAAPPKASTSTRACPTPVAAARDARRRLDVRAGARAARPLRAASRRRRSRVTASTARRRRRRPPAPS